MAIAAKIDEFGKPAWIVLLILGFIWWWPLGLAILAFMIGSRRMGAWNHNDTRQWQDRMDRMRSKVDSIFGGICRTAAPPSGNRAFDQYRSDTLSRLEEEQREFKEFLQRLRVAKDRAEFDQFMAERRDRSHDDGSQPKSQP